ncbi:hypothetical protein N7466_010638 [Penicillium verhagenii]|uniref:uncharacterized protein n=1 Tax=Penicillium verhagenii TaxID=1562060 RepID=UPI002545971C|nr:uncharacterized protein N7466_010638 [Penicillium verhagenii]KAJ5918646.1 hypothetical protein N7466_010638 [Penicillium verhagenii]
MSSNSSSDHDNSDDSDFSLESNRGRQQRRSNSQLEPFDLSLSVSQDQNPPQDHENFESGREGANEDEPNSSQTRWEHWDTLLAILDEKSLTQYTTLLEQTESDISTTTEATDDDETTQIGTVIWTAAEKISLFQLLGRKGKNGLGQVAALLGSKSELEVLDYLKVLQRGLEDQHILKRQLNTIILGDVPAAMEVSKECCAELDKYARVLTMREDLDVEIAGRVTYDDNAIIAKAQAKKLIAREINAPLPGRIDLAANLFNIPHWIHLSETMFMNFGGSRSEDCWSNIVQSKSESPSLHGEALMDFYALTMSVTRRLIQSALFFAMSRLHGLHAIGRDRGSFVRKRDVRAALDVLNMEHDRGGASFFVNLARRNRLTITDDVDDEKEPRTISYDEALQITHEDEDSNNSDQDDILSQSEGDSQSKLEAAGSQPAPIPIQRSLPQIPKTAWEEMPLDPEDEHANLLDLEMSRREEIKLWHLLEEPVPSRLNASLVPENEIEKDALSRKPAPERKSREDLVDWRDRTLYRGDWEDYKDGTQDLEAELVENRQKRRWAMYEEGSSEEEIERSRRPRKRRPSDHLPTNIVGIDDSADEDTGDGAVEDNEAPDGAGEDRMDVDEPSPSLRPSIVVQVPRHGSTKEPIP